MPHEIIPAQYIRVPLWRRGAALGIDIAAVGLVSSTLATGAIALFVIFLLLWLGLRVGLVSRNQGQSLGRWALDMKVVDANRGGTPDLKELTQREVIVGCGAALSWLGLLSLAPATAWALLLFLPLGLDLSLAVFDPEGQQALHDQLTKTRVVQTRRGYSLDLKIQKLLATVQRRMK
jgi:uncharacterized RDD family membrane protein YckC